MINQEITILDGVALPAGLPDREAGIKTSYSPTGLGLGLSVAIVLGKDLNHHHSMECRDHLHSLDLQGEDPKARQESVSDQKYLLLPKELQWKKRPFKK